MFEKTKITEGELKNLSIVTGRGRRFSTNSVLWDNLQLWGFQRGEICKVPAEYKAAYGYIRARLSRFMASSGGSFTTKTLESGELLIACLAPPQIAEAPPVIGDMSAFVTKTPTTPIPYTTDTSSIPSVGIPSSIIPEVQLKLTEVPPDQPLPGDLRPTKEELHSYLTSLAVGDTFNYIEGKNGTQLAMLVEEWANELEFIQAFIVGSIVEMERID